MARDEKLDRLEQVLKGAQEAAPAFEPDRRWQQDVMLAVRREANRSRVERAASAKGLVWQRAALPFAGLASAAALVMVVIDSASGPGVEQQLASLITFDPTALLRLGFLAM